MSHSNKKFLLSTCLTLAFTPAAFAFPNTEELNDQSPAALVQPAPANVLENPAPATPPSSWNPLNLLFGGKSATTTASPVVQLVPEVQAEPANDQTPAPTPQIVTWTPLKLDFIPAPVPAEEIKLNTAPSTALLEEAKIETTPKSSWNPLNLLWGTTPSTVAPTTIEVQVDTIAEAPTPTPEAQPVVDEAAKDEAPAPSEPAAVLLQSYLPGMEASMIFEKETTVKEPYFFGLLTSEKKVTKKMVRVKDGPTFGPENKGTDESQDSASISEADLSEASKNLADLNGPSTSSVLDEDLSPPLTISELYQATSPLPSNVSDGPSDLSIIYKQILSYDAQNPNRELVDNLIEMARGLSHSENSVESENQWSALEPLFAGHDTETQTVETVPSMLFEEQNNNGWTPGSEIYFLDEEAGTAKSASSSQIEEEDSLTDSIEGAPKMAPVSVHKPATPIAKTDHMQISMLLASEVMKHFERKNLAATEKLSSREPEITTEWNPTLTVTPKPKTVFEIAQAQKAQAEKNLAQHKQALQAFKNYKSE